MRTHHLTGIADHDTTVVWTTLRQEKSGWTAESPQRIEAGSGTMEERAAAMQPAFRGLTGEVTLGLPSADLLLRVLDLPTSVPEEIEGMVALQLDKISPFPVDQMRSAWETLSSSDTGSRVLVAAIPSDRINSFCAPFQKAGLAPTRLDARILGWLECLGMAGEIPSRGGFVGLLVDSQSAELIVIQEGVPVVFVSLGPTRSTDPEATARIVAEEAVFALESMEMEDVPKLPVRAWILEGNLRDPLAARLQLLPGWTVEIRATEAVPELSEGLARRTSRETCLNLLPVEWRETAARKRSRKQLLVSSLWLFGTFALVLLLGTLLFSIQKRRTQQLKLRLAALEEPAKEMRALQSRLAALEQYSDPKGSVLEAMREIVSVLPQGIELTSFSFRKGSALALRGQASAPDPVYDFIQALQRSSFFTEIDPAPVQTRPDAGPMPVQFSITCKLPGSVENETDQP
jgi:Tfp pilus assembly protein PilN